MRGCRLQFTRLSALFSVFFVGELSANFVELLRRCSSSDTFAGTVRPVSNPV